jgi:hypothetical protein
VRGHRARRTITRPRGPVLRCGSPRRQRSHDRLDRGSPYVFACGNARRQGKADYCGWPASTVSGSASTRAPS